MSVYIHDGLRSPIGVLNGQYKYMRPEILGAQLIDELINRHTISQVDGIFLWQRGWHWWEYWSSYGTYV